MKGLLATLTRPKYALPSLVLLAVLLRIPSFFPPVIDHDESTYLIMASGLLDGDLLYRLHIDVKPPGIFLLFAFALGIWKHYMSVRILAALSIGLSAWLIYLAVRRFWNSDHRQALIAGVLFIIASSLHRWEWSANTEIFFNLFTLAALAVLLKFRNIRGDVWFSLLMGLGFIIKYHVIFDFTVLWFVLRGVPLLRNQMRSFFASGFLSLGFFLLPFGLVVLFYILQGEWGLFREVSFDIPSRYRVERNLIKTTQFSGEFILGFLPFILMWIGSVVHVVLSRQKEALMLAICWPVFSITAVLMTGKSFYHYWIQALPPLIFIAANPAVIGYLEHRLPKISAVILLLALMAVPLHQWMDLRSKKDHVTEIADLIKKDLNSEDRIFVDYKNVIYFLCDQKPVNRYVHTTLMHDSAHIKAFGIDTREEYQKIREARPKWMVLYGKGHPFISGYTDSFYVNLKSYGQGVGVWKRKEYIP